MVRGKTQLRRIENSTSRQVTFSKRRNGLLKKAFELSVLCDAEVGLIVFSPSGKLYEFSNTSLQRTIERYQKYTKDTKSDIVTGEEVQNTQVLKDEAVTMTKKIDILEASKRKLLGEDLGSSSIDELQEMENQLERSLSMIRAKKTELYKERIEQLKEKEKILSEENAMLYGKSNLLPWHLSPQQQHTEPAPQKQNSQISEVENEPSPDSLDNYSEVETELFIGRPDRGRTVRQAGL